MVEYEIIKDNEKKGFHVVKILSGTFDGLLLSIYNVGCNGIQMYYNYNIINNNNKNVDSEELNDIIKEILNDLYFKEF